MPIQRPSLNSNSRHETAMVLKWLLYAPYSLRGFREYVGICQNVCYSIGVEIAESQEMFAASKAYWQIYGALWSTDPELASSPSFPVDCQAVYLDTDNKWAGVHLQRRINFMQILLSILQAGTDFSDTLILSMRFLETFGYIGPITYYHAGTEDCVGYFLVRDRKGFPWVRRITMFDAITERAVIDDYGNLILESDKFLIGS